MSNVDDMDEVAFRNVCYTTESRAPDNPILVDVSGRFKNQTVAAIMGPSGSGKTTLLDILAKRKAGGTVTGSLPNVQQSSTGYVTQDIVLPVSETVFETLTLYTDLTMPSTLTALEKTILVDDIIEVLKLTHVRDNVIGGYLANGNELRGLSGGEKRRVLIGCSLVRNPRLLLLDEPTTGLDASKALDVIKALRALTAVRAITIATTLHQPRPEIWFQLDQVIVLCKGVRMFDGSPADIATFLVDQMQVPPDDDKSAADFALDYFSHFDREQAYEVRAKFEETYQERMITEKDVAQNNSEYEPCESDKNRPGPFERFVVLIKREYRITIQERNSLYIQIGFNWLLYLYASLPYVSTRGTFVAMQHDTLSAVGIFVIMAAWTSTATIPIIIHSRRLFLYERAAGLYDCSEWYFAVLVKDIVLKFIRSTVQWFIMWFLLHLHRSAGTYFFGWMGMFFANIVPTSWVFLVCAVSVDAQTALAINQHLSNLFILFSSFYITVYNLPMLTQWIVYANPLFYLVSLMEQNEFDYQQDIVCDGDEMECFSGYLQCVHHGYTILSKFEALGVAIGFMIFFHVIASLVMTYNKYDMAATGGGDSMSEFDTESDNESETGGKGVEELPLLNKAGSSTTGGSGYDSVAKSGSEASSGHSGKLKSPVTWKNVEYEVDLKDLEVKPVLVAAQGSVAVGCLCALMGPSGAGKSTLLDVLAAKQMDGRLKGMRTDVKGLDPNEVVYVTQDEVLCATDSVFEVLSFYAQLAMPRSVTVSTRNRIIRRVMKSMKLMHVKNTAVGGTLAGGVNYRGVSGGEKRRVSIAVALLRNPSLLLLDEPTSGLDSGAALEVMSILKSLAHDGNTIIVTIHQPRHEIWRMIDHVNLLAKGVTVFEGTPLEAEKYIEDLSRPREPTESAADFVLDYLCTLTTSEEAFEIKHKWDDFNTITYDDRGTVDLRGAAEESSSDALNIDVPIMNANGDPERVNYFSRTAVVIVRHFRSVFRVRANWLTIYLAVMIKTLIVSLASFGLQNNPYESSQVNSKVGLCFFFVMQEMLMSNGSMSLFQSGRALFFHERRQRLYGASEYFAAVVLIDLFFFIFIPGFFFAGIVYVAGKFNPIPVRVVIGLYVGTITNMVGGSFYTLAGIGMPNMAYASMFGNVMETSSAIYAGFLLKTSNIRSWIRWVAYLVPARYALHALILNEYHDTYVACEPDVTDKGTVLEVGSSVPSMYHKNDTDCYTGNEIVNFWGADLNPPTRADDMVILLMYALGQYFIAYLVLVLAVDRIRRFNI